MHNSINIRLTSQLEQALFAYLDATSKAATLTLEAINIQDAIQREMRAEQASESQNKADDAAHRVCRLITEGLRGE